jgi:uncharacterized protein (TIGR03437 family)
MTPKCRLIAKFVTFLTLIPLFLWAFSFGPDPGHTGAPGESDCTQCHTGTALNGGGGSVTVAFPAGQQYTPGVKQHLVVTVTDSTQKLFGFQLTARKADNSQAGSFTPTDATAQVLCSTGPSFTAQALAPCPANLPLQFVEHTLQGEQQGKSSYEFDWTPPSASAGVITIYVAGNAVNGDFSPAGDHIYTNKYTLMPAAAGPPTISAVVNGASFQPGISAGSWVTIQGNNLASAAQSWNGPNPDGTLPTSVAGVSVTINGKPAAVSFVSPTQINAQAPADSAVGPVPAVVTTGAGASAPFTAQVQTFAPAFFLWSGKYAVATRPDFSLAAKPNLFPGVTTTPAKPGEVIILWGTGFGPTNPAIPAGQVPGKAAVPTTNPTVTIGGVTAELIGAALSPQFAGLYQIAVRVPASTGAGDAPIVVNSGGVNSPDGVFLTVQP